MKIKRGIMKSMTIKELQEDLAEVLVERTVQEWAWKMDWCKENGLSPASSWVWSRAEEEYNKVMEDTKVCRAMKEGNKGE